MSKAELDVLKGSLTTLARNNYPPLVCEAWTQDWFLDQKDALMKFVADLGYVISADVDDNFFAQHRSRTPHIGI